MKKFVAAVAVLAFATTAIAQNRHHHHRDHYDKDLAAAALIIGSIGAIAIATQRANQPQVVVPAPGVVYPHPGYPQPIYQPRVLTPQPRVMTSHDPCLHYGQMVQTYDQFGHPMGFQICR